jgi:ribulose-phosphate 3-epimerase
MGIAKIGYQGQPFDPGSLENVRVVRAAFPDLPIAFDGAVSEATAPEIFAAGAGRLVVGSAIIGAENPRAAARAIEAAAQA